MPLSLEQSSELVKIFAIIVGGGWAAWTFHSLQQARHAEIDLNRKIADLRKSRLEIESETRKRLREQPVLAITLEAQEVANLSQMPGSILSVMVTLKNEGDLNLNVTFDASALTVGRITWDEHHRQFVEDVGRTCHWYIAPRSRTWKPLPEPRIFRVGQARKIPFAAHLVEPGVYLVQFQAEYEKRAFDGEPPFREAPEPIIAFEQVIHVATGKQGEQLRAD